MEKNSTYSKKSTRHKSRIMLSVLVVLIVAGTVSVFGLKYLNKTEKKDDILEIQNQDKDYIEVEGSDSENENPESFENDAVDSEAVSSPTEEDVSLKSQSIDIQKPEQHSKTVAQWNLRLVNPWNKITDNSNIELEYLANGHAIDKRAYPDLQKMMDDCRAEGLSPLICSSYRSMEKQQSLFDKQINKYTALGYANEDAEIEAAKLVAIPGTSEHQLGLAVDIVSVNNQVLTEAQEETAEQKWLMENCYKYGFILRYPSDKSEITGIDYEPWHYRYVGKEVAKEIMDSGVCLEEYLDSLK